MLELRKFLNSAGSASRAHRALDSGYPARGENDAALDAEYASLISRQLRRFGIDPACVSVEVKKAGVTADGLAIFVGMIQLARWERVSALRVLLGLPMLETEVRHAVRASWLGDVTHFGGVWLNASRHLRGADGIGELRDLMLQLTPLGVARAEGGPRHGRA